MWHLAAAFLEQGGFSGETYRLQTLDGILTDVHAPRLFHLHVAQVLRSRGGETRWSHAVTQQEVGRVSRGRGWKRGSGGFYSNPSAV